MEEIEDENKKQARLDNFDREGWIKWTKQTRISHFPVEKMGSFFVLHFSSKKYGKIIIFKTFLTHQPLPS